MSCSHLIETYTNSKYIFRGPNRFRQSYECGKCSSCVSKHRTDWRVRAYYEILGCLKKNVGAFVLFDTLTYSDDHIKRYSDIFPDMSIPVLLDKPCFSRDDVQKFFKRLRINLYRAGYRFRSVDLRYILTSEYGSSEKTRGFLNTHRPHYHILFFVSFPINPVEFSRFVSRSWYLGKTDGVRPYDDCSFCPVKKFCRGTCIYQSVQYVLNERLVNTNTSGNCLKAVNYVTKYISKDLYIGNQLQNNVDLLFRYLYPDYLEDVFLYRKYRKFCGQVLPFHLQSLGFGMSLLDSEEKDFIIETNKVRLPTGKANIVACVSLPRYYQRKLYYNYKKIDGRVVWSLSKFGIETKLRQLDNNISSFMREYRAFDKYISSSRLYDLALYKLVYRGTLTDYQSLFLPYKTYYRRLLSSHELEVERPLYYNFNTKRDKLTVGAFLSTSYSVTSDGEILFKGKQLHKEFIPYDGYLVVNDRVCSYWYGFDRKILAFNRWRRGVALSRDVVQTIFDSNVDYYKQLGLLT